MKKLGLVLLLKNNLIYYAIGLTITTLSINNILYSVLLLPYIYFIYKSRKHHLKYIVIVSILFLVSYSLQFSNKIIEKDFYEVTVLNDIEISEYTNFIGKIGNDKVKVYLKDEVTLKAGDVLKVSGELKLPDKATSKYGFDYRNYLKSQRIYYTFFTESYEIIDHRLVINSLPYWIENYIDCNIVYSKEYVKTFILANKDDFDQQTINEINNLGISHLFAVSGMHIALIVLVLKYFLDKAKITEKKSDLFISLFLILYIVLTSFTPSVTRASFMFILLVINKRKELAFTTLDILSIIFITLLLINPFYIYSLGFILSFFVTFIILLSKNILMKKSSLMQLAYISSIAFFFTLPLVMNINHEINLLSIVYNLFFIYLVTFVLLPMSYLVFILPFFDSLFNVIIKIFESLLSVMYHVDFMKTSMSFHNVVLLIIYYLILVLIMIKLESKKQVKKYLYSLAILILMTINIAKFNIFSSVTFIDVYGDSTLIIDKFDQCNILIDTGEVDDYNTVVNYMKNKGIKRIDYLIISHMHSDHYGEVNDVIKNFKITNIVSNDNQELFSDRNLSCGNLQFYIYPLSEKVENENNNSLIVTLNIEGDNYLFTGDIEESAEIDFISKNHIETDILKVAHHGSNTSSTEAFIESVSPKEAVIIAHRYNKFNHPSQETLDTLDKYGVIIHQTKIDGTIEFKYIFKKRYIFSNPAT